MTAMFLVLFTTDITRQKFIYALSVLGRSHPPFSSRTYVINWNQVFFNWFPDYSQMFRAENLKFEEEIFLSKYHVAAILGSVSLGNLK